MALHRHYANNSHQPAQPLLAAWAMGCPAIVIAFRVWPSMVEVRLGTIEARLGAIVTFRVGAIEVFRLGAI